MDRFLGHRYWGRAWVIQEIARGREVHILYGSQFLDWKQVAYSFGLMTQPPLYQYMNKNLIVDVARRLSTGEPGDSVKAMSATAIDSTKIPFLDKTKRVRSQGLLPLTAALEWSSASEATKPSDKIFALRGLVLHDSDLTSKMAYALRPDSSSSYTRVFTRVAKFLLSTDPEYLFRRAGVGFQRREPNDNTVLPSWVPDWTQQLSVIELEPQPYRAGGMGKFKADILDNGHICIPVIEICALVSLTEPMVPTAKNDSGMQTYFVKSALALFDSEPDIYLPQGQTRTEAFWRTIISNTVRRTPTTALQYPVPLNWNEKFESWKTSILDPDFDHVQNLQNFEPRGDRGQDFNLNFIVACQSRCFAISEGGYMVLVPELAKKGDKVCVIPGIGLPVVFRKNEKGDLWVYVGTCYVHGLMDGEAINLGRPVMDYVVV
ncbi:hypothetical protein G7Y89_g12221 [Cudoniella acicularis]|uniref:Heterokaryon incompatibility domain-containing protein n=1 Tax=Cudoniella acicularis TaxID=354080 RepID=A0A8H4R9G1_9HELO|nr:hypothetical protein G7Y89_g12221 [Cudoniella acicularis]